MPNTLEKNNNKKKHICNLSEMSAQIKNVILSGQTGLKKVTISEFITVANLFWLGCIFRIQMNCRPDRVSIDLYLVTLTFFFFLKLDRAPLGSRDPPCVNTSPCCSCFVISLPKVLQNQIMYRFCMNINIIIIIVYYMTLFIFQ